MKDDLKNKFLKENDKIIYVYKNCKIKKIALKDLKRIINGEYISLNLKNLTIKLKKDMFFFKEIEDSDEAYNWVDDWFYHNSNMKNIKNYLYYEDFSIVNFDNPFDGEELKKYKILNIIIENNENWSKYTIEKKDLQLAVMMIENKTWAVDTQFGIKTKNIIVNDKNIEPNTINYLDLFEEAQEKDIISIEIEYEHENHKFMVSYPEFKNGIGYKIVIYV